MAEKKVRTRFAPSPTGFMHVGNLRTALYEYLIAKSLGGDFVLRIEDTDQERKVEGAVDIIYNTLAKAGLRHDEGPDVGGEYGPYVQSERKDMYMPYANELLEKGHAYRCFCTKERLDGLRANSDDPGAGYDRHCRNLSDEEIQELLDKGTPFVIRQKMPLEGTTTFEDAVYGTISVENAELQDQILIKADGFPTYNWEIPTYIHLPLIMGKNDDGSISKLSKRHGATSFEDLTAQGFLPEAIINYIALLGWAPKDNREMFTLDELVENFSIDGISKSPAVFDYDKLEWFNGEYIKAMTVEEFAKIAEPYFRQALGDKEIDYVKLASILQQRTTKLTQIPEKIAFFAELPEYEKELFVNKKSKTNLENVPGLLKAGVDALEALDEWNHDSIHDCLIGLAQKLEVKNGTAMWPVRIAASGMTVTPGGAVEILDILGREEALARLHKGLEKLK